MGTIVHFLLILMVVDNVSAQDIGTIYEPFQNILNRYHVTISDSKNQFATAFDYKKAFKEAEFKELHDKQLQNLNNFTSDQLTDKAIATAFYINAYNFLMIAKIYKDGYSGGELTINSVRNIGSFLGLPSTRAFTDKDFYVGSQKMSLDEIEKGRLLGEEFEKKGWKDARIHFAVNCASVGCPPLLKKIYHPQTLDKTLTSNVERALATHRHLKVQDQNLRVTKLFDWYEADFTEEKGSVKSWILTYVTDRPRRQLIKKAKRIRYIPYDWNLNKPANFEVSK